MRKYTFDELRRQVYADPNSLDEIKETQHHSAKRLRKLEHANNYTEKFKKDGLVIIHRAITKKQVKECVSDIWESIINLPWKSEYKEKWEEINNSFFEDYWRDCTKAEAQTIKSCYASTGGFGALTMPTAFHLRTQWKTRQNPLFVNIARTLLGEDDILASIDRTSFKATGQGENEFTHWDSNPFTWPDEECEGIQGLLALSDTCFYAVPKTHTEKFRQKFIENYPRGKRQDQYHVTKVHDPLQLQSKVQKYTLRKGDWIIWSNRLLHEAKINTSSKIRYAYFISYFPKGKSQAAVKKYYDKAGVDEIEDRIYSYNTGANPRVFPSGTEISLYAKVHMMYHPEVLDKFCDRFIPAVSQDYTYKSGAKKGRVVRLPVNYEPKSLGLYTPPALSDLGREMLGIMDN